MKNSITAISLVLLSASAFAADSKAKTEDQKLNVKLGGTLDTQAAITNQKQGFNKNNYNGNTLNKGAIVNETRIKLNIDSPASASFKYGSVIELYADSSSHTTADPDKNTPAAMQIGKKIFLFGETKFGKVEIGSGNSATDQMGVSANNIARAPGGINGKAQKWISTFTAIPGVTYKDRVFYNHFVKWPKLPFDCDCSSSANKITYFTPKLSGLQFGLSYVPDEQMRGTVAKTQSVFSKSDSGYKNVFNGALKYEAKLNEVEFQTALIGEFGKAKNTSDTTKARRDLAAWELGSLVKYKGFSVAGSYSDWGKTGTPKIKEAGRKYGASYWTAGIGYEYDKFGTSLTYFNSKRANVYNDSIVAAAARDVGYNKFELVSLGMDYKIVEGFMPYAEVNVFKTKQRTAAANNRGSVVIAGTKLSF